MSSVELLLQQWGFAKYVDVFKENEVDLEALRLLDDAQIKLLIPIIGPQAKFKKTHADWKLSLEKSSEILQTEEVIEEIISKYGDTIEGLSPSLTSPTQSLPSPSTSSRSVSSVSSRAQFDLTSLLEIIPDGQMLLKHTAEKTLGEQNRKILVRAISKEIVRHDPKVPVTAGIYLYWLQEIKRLFPSENPACYYTKPKGGLQRAHGRLYDAVINLKAKYRRHKVYQPRARRSLDKTLTPEPSTSTSTYNESVHTIEVPITQEEEECLEWLRCSSDDFALCAEKWQKTNKQRKQRVLSNEKESYLQEFPCLKRSWGYKLLTADFDQWYPQNEHALEDKLPLLKNKLLCASKITSRLSPFVQELKLLAQDQDPETSSLAALLLVPHMIGPVYIKKKKCSAAEVRQSFILHIEEDRQLLEERLKRQERYKALGITIQPYIVVVGPLKKITARYVVFDDIIYELPTISITVDVCFKIIWALNLEYPSGCLPVWQFLERAIYNFSTNVLSKNKLSSSLISLLSDCGTYTE